MREARTIEPWNFIEDGKEDQANNMLNAEDNIMHAFINEVEAQSGKKIAEEDARHLIAEATDIRALIQLAIGTPI
jgi:predicted metal-binding transcription factor (methanogenesis marker protein 9)